MASSKRDTWKFERTVKITRSGRSNGEQKPYDNNIRSNWVFIPKISLKILRGDTVIFNY